MKMLLCGSLMVAVATGAMASDLGTRLKLEEMASQLRESNRQAERAESNRRHEAFTAENRAQQERIRAEVEGVQEQRASFALALIEAANSRRERREMAGTYQRQPAVGRAVQLVSECDAHPEKCAEETPAEQLADSSMSK